MIKGQKVLVIIPARGGSKRLPRKNVLDFNGKPLIYWTINAAKQSKYVDRIITSTDCEEIASVSNLFGSETPFQRPTELSTDTANSNDVILHCLNYLTSIEMCSYEIVVLLQPTSPLRTVDDIDKAIEKLVSENINGVVSVCECEHSPLWANVLPGNQELNNFLKTDSSKRSQELKKYYRLNGAIYCFRTETIYKHNGINYIDEVFAYIMEQKNSIDIDSHLDFKIARVIANE